MAQPASTIGRIAERIGGTSEVVSSAAVAKVPNRTDVLRVIEWVAGAPVYVPPVMWVTAIAVGVARHGQHEHTEKHQRGQTFHDNQIPVLAEQSSHQVDITRGIQKSSDKLTPGPAYLRCRLVGEVGLEPTKAKPADLQSAPFAARDIPPAPSADDRRRRRFRRTGYG
jgi:hypothetical protein